MESEDDSKSEYSLYEALSGSERLVKGQVQLDWRTLPPTVVAALPDPPPSAKRYLKRRAQQPERDDVDDFTQSFVSQKLAEWASRSLGSGMANDDDQIKAKQYPSLRRSLNDTSKENIRPPTRSASADANSHLFTTKQHDMSSISSSHPRGSKLSQQGSAPDPTVNTSDRPGKSPDTTTQMTSSIQTDIRNLAESHSALQVSRNAVESSRQYSELNSLLNQLQQIKDQVNGGRPERLKNDLRRSELKPPQEATEDADLSLTDLINQSEPLRVSSVRTSCNAQESQRVVSNSSAPSPIDQDALLRIHSELRVLASKLKDKSRSLLGKEQAVRAREKEVQTRESEIVTEVETLVAQSVKNREAVITKETEAIVKRYEEALSGTLKENRRLQNSVKELVAANRQLRDQISKLETDAMSKDRQLVEQRNQLKLSRDRNLRLRNTVASIKPAIVMNKKEKPSKLEQAKQIVLTQSRKPTRNAASQTMTSEPPPRSAVESNANGRESVFVAFWNLTALLLHLRRGSLSQREQPLSLYQSIIATFAYFAERCNAESSICFGTQHLDPELYLGFVFECMQDAGFTTTQKYEIAHLAYDMLMKSRDSYNTRGSDALRQTDRLLLYFIVLCGVTQCDVIEAVLDSILTGLASDEAKDLYVNFGGVEITCSFLKHAEMNIQFLASSALLGLCTEGEWLHQFLHRCSAMDTLDAISHCLQISYHLGTVENLSVVLQKMSKSPDNWTKIRNHPTIIPRLKKFLDGDLSSEFLVLNIHSILNNDGY